MLLRRDGGAGQLRDVMDSLPDGVAIVSREGTFVFVNQQMEVLSGYPSDELLGREVEDLVPTDLRSDHRRHRARFHRLPTRRPMGAELHLKLRRKDGTELPVDISLGPLEGAGEVVVVVRDAGYHRMGEQATRRSAVVGERLRLARRLQDEVIHSLFGVGLSLQAIELETDSEATRQKLHDAVIATDRAIAELRKVIFDSTDPFS